MHEGKQYNITLRWNAQEHVYIAQADDISGVVGKGDTRAKAIAAVEDAIRWWLESGTEGTRPPETPAPAEGQRPG